MAHGVKGVSSSGPSLANEGAHRCVGALDGGHCQATELQQRRPCLSQSSWGPVPAGPEAQAQPVLGEASPGLPPGHRRPPPSTLCRFLIGVSWARGAPGLPIRCGPACCPRRRAGGEGSGRCCSACTPGPHSLGEAEVRSERGPSWNEQVKVLLGASCRTFVSPAALPAPHGSACPHRCGAESQAGGGFVPERP